MVVVAGGWLMFKDDALMSWRPRGWELRGSRSGVLTLCLVRGQSKRNQNENKWKCRNNFDRTQVQQTRESKGDNNHRFNIGSTPPLDSEVSEKGSRRNLPICHLKSCWLPWLKRWKPWTERVWALHWLTCFCNHPKGFSFWCQCVLPWN